MSNEVAVADTIPDIVEPRSLNDYLEVMARAIFQAGVRWKQIAEHWSAYRTAYEDFDVRRVALYDDLDIERVLETPGVLRSQRKARAIVTNAKALCETQTECGDLQAYLRSFDSYEALAKDMKKRFAFIGDLNVWYFLFRIGEPVPRFEEWIDTIDGTHPRMREMVDRARAQGRSPEV
jgi:3-methyladenine DNA glycosylase Tag